jgi:polysaccharide deacetylase family protein (PEP-CTERM system associated)
MLNALTIDVEEYFHPTEVSLSAPFEEWDLLPSRVEEQIDEILHLLEDRKVSGTFFILGWVAQRHSRMVERIASAGHEIGCHSHLHRLVYNLTPEEFRRDTELAVRTIEDACGLRPRVYRAPSYSIVKRSLWALEILVEAGFTHDSSIYPISHDRYGIPGFRRHAHTLKTPSGSLQEVPIATVRLSNSRVAPVGGGGYLRLLPYCYTAAGIRRINTEENQPACVYFHPWEIDPGQPRLASNLPARLRTYMGIRGMSSKLDRLLSEFRFASLREVYKTGEKDTLLQSAAATLS